MKKRFKFRKEEHVVLKLSDREFDLNLTALKDRLNGENKDYKNHQELQGSGPKGLCRAIARWFLRDQK